MSTLSGVPNKGEKGKSKFQSLDINSLYKASRGESLENHQHKNISSRRHGMQTLGKIPSARRAPANLPSLKSEYSGNDPAVSLVPCGGSGWGNKPGETGPPPSTTQVPTTTTPTATNVTSTTESSVTATVSTPPTQNTSPAAQTILSHSDKSWSSVTSNSTEATPMYLAHQSPYFQQEFPSLSRDANAVSGSNKTDASHLPGPSLRPQTEGSWMQGGSRPQVQTGAGVGNQMVTVPAQGPLSHHPPGLDVGGGRNNLAPSGVGAGLAGHIPPAGLPLHHYRLMPQFMIRHNHPSGGFPPNYHGPPRLRFPYSPDTRLAQGNKGALNVNQEEVTTRPIIKEEDLKVMDDIPGDSGWAAHDEIDYNQTLSFSDEEGALDDKLKTKKFIHPVHAVDRKDLEDNYLRNEDSAQDCEENLKQENSRETVIQSQSENREHQRIWHQPRSSDLKQATYPPSVHPLQPIRAPMLQSGKQGEEEDVWRERRRLQNEEIAIAVERAKQRKEEEEKRYEETRQAAAKKLHLLEEKLRAKVSLDKEDIISSHSNVQHLPSVLLPDWEKDKDKNMSKKPIEDKGDKTSQEVNDNTKTVQVESKCNKEKEQDRDQSFWSEREVAQPFSRQFQNNLPPRFQKQTVEKSPNYRQCSGESSQLSATGQSFYESRWPVNTHFGGLKSYTNHNDSNLSENDREEIRDSNVLEKVLCESGVGDHDKDEFERSFDTDDFKKDNNTVYKYYSDKSELGDKPAEIFNPISLNKGDSLKENEFNDRSLEIEKRDIPLKGDSKDHPERLHRHDSQDSRTVHDIHVFGDSSRDEAKVLEENNIQVPLPWAEKSFEVEHKIENYKKDIREDCEFRRDSHVMSYHQRHIPGPITKEKLEASELKSESGSLNLVPLIRSDKKLEMKKTENQWDVLHGGSHVGAWQPSPAPQTQMESLSSEGWTDVSVSTDSKTKPFAEHIDTSHGDQSESSFTKIDFQDSSKKAGLKESDVDKSLKSAQLRDNKIGRGGNRGMRYETRGMRVGWNSGSFYRGGASSWRGGETRGRKYQHRRPNTGYECAQNSESEASAEEVSASIESGKEDKRLDQDRKHFTRSEKQGNKKFDRDEKTKENRKSECDKEVFLHENDSRRYDKKGVYEGSRLRGNFEPRGEPSRRGRGAPFRSKGSAANVGRRMDGYGPPTSKKPFTSESTNQVQEEKKTTTNDSSQILNVSEEEKVVKMSHDDKMKMNQQQLTAGIIGSAARFSYKSQPPNLPPRMQRKSESEKRVGKTRDSLKIEPSKIGSVSGCDVDENWETTSETSENDEKDQECKDKIQHESLKKSFSHNPNFSRGHQRRQPQSNSSAGRDKHSVGSFDRDRDHRKSINTPGSLSVINGSIRPSGIKNTGSTKEQMEIKATDQPIDKKQLRTDKEKRNNLDRIDLCNTASVVVIDDQLGGNGEEDHTVFTTDNNGFQEVRSKKNVKDANRQTKEEPSRSSKERSKPSKPHSPGPPATSLVTSTTTNKGVFDRPRTVKLPPRFAKLRENTRLQKMTQHVQDANEINKINAGGASGFLNKDLTSPAPPPPVNAWDKPITATLRTSTPPTSSTAIAGNCLDDSCNVDSNDHLNSNTSSQRSSPNEDKAVAKPTREPTGNDILDGASPPVQTIIFENTNYKSTPIDVAVKSKYTSHIKNQKCKDKRIEDDNPALGFNAAASEITMPESKAEPMMPISFNKNEDTADMKLDFRFDSDLSQLTDDKTNKSLAAMQMTRSIQIAAQTSAAELQFKLASVKKVWENSSAAIEHGSDDAGAASSSSSYTPTFSNSVEDPSTYSGKAGVDTNIGDDSSSLTPEGVYNAGQQLSNSSSTYNGSTVQSMIKSDPSSNVCKVKPQPQAAILPHSGPLSPPSGVFTSSPVQPSQHISYQPAAQYGGIPAIPSPPTVYTPQAELYPTFQINNPQVIGSQVQGRSQFSQFAPYLSQSLGQTSGFSQQSLYHVQPPNTAPPNPHDIFQSQLSQYRIQPPNYGASQQLSNNPNTVLISSSTNSLMSANVKPSPPPIGAIGSKTASYQTPTQPPPSQLYIYPDPQMLSQSPYLQNSQLVQRPTSNVVPTIPPSSASYYSTSAGGGGATGYFQPGNSGLQAAAANMHQPTFSIPGFNTQAPAATPAGMGSFGSTSLSNGLQMVQQYRSTAPLTAADHQDMFSVFSPVAQINPSKSRGGGGKPGSYNSASQQQPSPTQNHKFTTYQQNVSPTTQLMIQQQQQHGSMSLRAAPRYPTPIQRPINYQSVGCQRFSSRYKLPPPPSSNVVTNTATATSASGYYVPQSNPTKPDNTDLEAKSEVPISTDCNNSSPVKLNKSASITNNDETSSKD